ncbi:TetR family transcriptional regulator [Niveispirillum lacus]|uniref:TetR family transcriptional regulator n=1 Tax=Niveispirillum lacus TaxID=1981099 RepID=A0A255YVY7_9PROT|nr:TetR/AcrR family transcriptional regulator [Niveispirillum lacus]OYQ33416.1 TetR family transcriptional regulator [Niveispirillum lacus]
MSATRTQIVEAADTLFYQQGFDHTSLADIAGAVGIARGNLTYHFKAKDEILSAVIDRRLATTQAMLDAWEAAGEEPTARIISFIHILIVNQAKIMAYGCPVGTLSTELAKLDHAGLPDAARIFALFRSWLARQFMLQGHGDTRADELALHLLGRSQGVATLATAFKDDHFIRREVAAMQDWLSSLAPTH